MSSVFTWVWNRGVDVFNGVRDWILWLRDRVWDAARWTYNAVIDRLGWLRDVSWDAARWTYNAVIDRLGWLRDVTWDAARWTYDAVVDRFDWLRDRVWDAARWTYDAVVDRFDWLRDRVWDAARWLWEHTSDSLAIAFNNTRDFFTDVKETVIERTQQVIELTGNALVGGAQAIGEFFQAGLRWLYDHVFDPVRDAIAVKMAIPRKLVFGEYETLEQLFDDLEDPLDPGSIAGFLFSMLALGIALPGMLSEVGLIKSQKFIQDAAKEVGRTIPSFSDLRDAFLRGLMSEATHDEWLGRAGYSQQNIGYMKELYFDLPTPSDLIRMAVREVFSPEVVERFGQLEDFPPQFALFAKQIGISDFWARAHWGAHWDLPSATQGFEMFHRAVIDHGTLELLLRALDVMPFWRDKLIQIAYRPVSRIDIRRMFRLGVVDRERVKRTYLDLGYAPDDAAKLTEFVVRDSAVDERDLPREVLESAYQDRLVTRDEALAFFRNLGFSDELADLFLDRVDLRVDKQLAGLAEDIIEADFKSGAIGEGAARSQLGELGVPDQRADLLVDLWSRKLAVRTRELTPAQLLRLRRQDVIGDPDLRDRLARAGYSARVVDYLFRLGEAD
ncbi:MAG: hypothetical protein ACREEO_06180, partial [Phenylobacterium sp.]